MRLPFQGPQQPRRLAVNWHNQPSKPPLWSSDMDPKDALGKYAKFSPPVVANGKVYVATFDQKIMVYGPK